MLIGLGIGIQFRPGVSGALAPPPAHTSLTWTTDEFDTTPQWDIGYSAGNIIADDVLEIDVCSDAGFTTREVLLQHTITSGEISGGAFSFTAGSALTLGDKYSRSRTVRAGVQGPWTSCTTLPKTLVAGTMVTPLLSLAGPAAGPNNTGTQYINCFAQGLSGGWQPAADYVEMPVPFDCTIDDLYVRFPVALTGAMTYTITLMVDNVASALAVTISSAGITGSNSTAVAVTAGQKICWRKEVANTPNAQTYVQIAATLSGASNKSYIGFCGQTPATASTEYLQPGVRGDWIASQSDAASQMPTAGTISRLYARCRTAPGVGKSYTFTLYKNGAPTALTCAVTDANTSNTDVTHSVAYVAGDTLSLECVPAGTPAASHVVCAVQFVPTTAGESVHFLNSITAPSNAAARYVALSGYGGGNNSTEAEAYIYSPCAFTAKKLYAEFKVAPDNGAGTQSRAFVMRKGGVSQTITVTLSEAELTKNDTTHSDAIAQGDFIDWMTTPSGTPAAPSIFKLSWVAAV